ncbi:MAG: hypothetical protein NT166_01375 [Candidatus Aminicenantes bacterium]|nr:hypothetical protein [Candidatus Aminicenantes bacterium]
MKHLKTVLLVTAIIIAFTVNAFPQLVAIGQSSEWEATGFNNGRRMVRDCSGLVDGFYHYVWHSQDNPANAPSGSDCDIFYACTDENGFSIIAPINLTDKFGFTDNRYPSIAIENYALDTAPSTWRTYNTLHVVWQCKQTALTNYEIMHGVIYVSTPAAPAPPPAPPAELVNVQNISQTPTRDSLVPAIDINHFTPGAPLGGQHIHVVWQEENVPHAGGANASDIFYTRSTDSGLTFSGPVSGGLWDNITNSPRHSQMPSIACAIDVFNGFPVQYLGFDCYYPTNYVHVAYNENTPLGVHVYYLYSTTDGNGWGGGLTDVTAAAGGGVAARDGYPNISCDMRNYAHIVFMRNVGRHSPLTTGYNPGMDPTVVSSFPGPNPGMYGALVNDIIYWSSNVLAPASPVLPAVYDREFPTVALDRFQNVTINWQECQIVAGVPGNYEVFRDYCFNLNVPVRPPAVPNYGAWAAGPNNDSNDAANDDLFPNLAHKKESMYYIRVAPFPGFTEFWNKVTGVGAGACMAPGPKNVYSRNNVARDAAVN